MALTDREKQKVDLIQDRYCRKTISGTGVKHHGDCRIGCGHPVCTCGLLHDLVRMPFLATELYPDFTRDLVKHDMTFDLLQEQTEEGHDVSASSST